MWLELFIVGGFWFWALIVLETVWVLRCLHEDSGWGIGGSFIFLSVLLWLFGDFNVFAWMWENQYLVLKALAGYFVVGVIWSIIRWQLLCSGHRQQYNEVRADFCRRHKIHDDVIPKDKTEEWRRALNYTRWENTGHMSVNDLNDLIPDPYKNKTKITYWLGYWPFSLLWFMFHDLIERVCSYVYQQFTYMYKNIATNSFAGVKDDF